MQITKELLSHLGVLSLEHYYLLYCKYYTNGMLVTYKPQAKIYEDLISWGYLTKAKNISSAGRKFLEKLWEKANMFAHIQDYSADFEEFWNAFPRTDAHSHFPVTRRDIRSNKSAAKVEFLRAVKDSEVSPSSLIEAVKQDVAWRKSKSTATDNKLKYIKNPSSWLKDEMYMSFMEEETSKQTTSNYGKSLS